MSTGILRFVRHFFRHRVLGWCNARYQVPVYVSSDQISSTHRQRVQFFIHTPTNGIYYTYIKKKYYRFHEIG